MSSARMFSYSSILCAVLVTMTSGSVQAEEDSGRSLMTRVYRLSRLPVWRFNREGQLQFDAAFLVDVIQRNVDTDAWGKDAFISIHEESRSMIIRQTRSHHEEIGLLLDEMRPK